MKLLLFAVGIVLLGQLSSAQTKKIEFNIFVLPKCGACHKFVTSVLYPNYNRFAKYIGLYFMPLAQGYNDADAEYLACVTNETQDSSTLQLDYYNCNFGGMGLKECAEKTGIDWNAIETCKKNGTGLILTGFNGQYAEYLGVKYVPSFVVDNVFDEAVTNNLRKNFVETLCDILNNPADACGDVQQTEYCKI